MGGVNRTTYNKEDAEKFLLALSTLKGLFFRTCKTLRISPDTINTWMDKYPAFAEAVEAVQEDEGELFMDDCEQLVQKKAVKNVKAAMFSLTNHPRGKKRGWGKKVDIKGELAVRSWVELMKEAGA